MIRSIFLLFLLSIFGNFCFAVSVQQDHHNQHRNDEEVRRDIMRMKLKKDSFRRSRGGKSAVYEIRCACCNTLVMYYQKDGTGRLLRCYLDRIMYPEYLENLAHDPAVRTKNDMPNLECSKCKKVIGVPMLYTNEGERRLAFRMIYDRYIDTTIKLER